MVGRDIMTSSGLIPKGSLCSLQFLLVFRNPDFFEEPDSYLPSRWENPTREMKDAFNPFSLGKQVRFVPIYRLPLHMLCLLDGMHNLYLFICSPWPLHFVLLWMHTELYWAVTSSSRNECDCGQDMFRVWAITWMRRNDWIQSYSEADRISFESSKEYSKWFMIHMGQSLFSFEQ